MRRCILPALAFLLLPISLSAQPRGSLFIVGGGPRPDSVTMYFLELAGGAQNARVLVLPNAAANAAETGASSARAFERLGVQARSLVLDTASANGGDVAAQFAWANAVWFPGGVQSRVTRDLGGTATEKLLREFYERGGVIGGTSAGAAIMSRLMLTGDERKLGGRRPPSDSSEAYITIDRDNIVTANGFGWLPPEVIIDQHFVRRKRHNRLMSLVLEGPGRVGIGIDEGTALIVTADGRWRVAGESVVVIYDARPARISEQGALAAAGMRMHVLPAGGWFNYRTGEAGLR